jgi:hypothetical protein
MLGQKGRMFVFLVVGLVVIAPTVFGQEKKTARVNLSRGAETRGPGSSLGFSRFLMLRGVFGWRYPKRPWSLSKHRDADRHLKPQQLNVRRCDDSV